MSSMVHLAPVAPWDEGAPVIHGPALTGASAGKPFSYAIPATGERPLVFSADNLPAGLTLDPVTGHITGRIAEEGEFPVLLKAANRHARTEKGFDIVTGRGLALTPPMGWNSWNAWRRWVDDAKVRAAAEHLVSIGLAARGYTYVNIDSCWQGVRGGPHNAIQPNAKFPDMAALSRFIHDRGLKFGIYSSPWVCPWGCTGAEALADWGGGELIGCSAGERDPDYPSEHLTWFGKYIGREKYEPNDVAQWVDWGVDYLKYDWTPTDAVSLERMGRCITEAKRDIVMSVCTAARLADVAAFRKWTTMWRGARDTQDVWSNILLAGFYAEENNLLENWRPHVGPGHWYDLDMTALGPQFDTKERTTPCKLTRDEQISHMSYWALYPSPLILSCNLADMDDFSLRLFGNEEIIAVNQDRLGRPAVRIRETRLQPPSATVPLHDSRVHARPLADGSVAVGLFNLSDHEDEVSVQADELGVRGRVTVRNLWERTDLGAHEGRINLSVPAHGTQMIRITSIGG